MVRSALHHVRNALSASDFGQQILLAVEVLVRSSMGVLPHALHRQLTHVLGERARAIVIRIMTRYLDNATEKMAGVNRALERIAEARAAIQDPTVTPDPAAAFQSYSREIRQLVNDLPQLETFQQFVDRYLRDINDAEVDRLLQDLRNELRRMRPPRGAAARVPHPTGSPVFSVFGAEERRELAHAWRDRAATLLASTDPGLQKLGHAYEAAAKRIEHRDKTFWWQTERELQDLFATVGGEAEVPFLYGDIVDLYAVGSTRPDIVHQGTLIEVKNYEVFDAVTGAIDGDRVNALIVELRRQIGDRVIQADPTARQRIILDFRGQPGSRADATAVAQRVVREVNDVIFEHLASPDARSGRKSFDAEYRDNSVLRRRMLEMSDVEILEWEGPLIPGGRKR